MPALTRRRCPDARQECWLIYYGDVHIGTIAIRSGIPHDNDPWGWSCGFYPGSEPGEYLTGTAATLDQTRAEFAKTWQVFRLAGPRPTIRRGAISAIGLARSIAASIAASACHRIGGRRPHELHATAGTGALTLPGGGKLFKLKDAIAWLAKEIPQSEHRMKQVQAAAHCVTEAAENGGPLLFARIGMMQAINRHKPVEFDPKRKSPHWGKRKLKRDE